MAEVEKTVERTSRVTTNTQPLAKSTRRVLCWRKSELRMGTETGVSWKDQEKHLDPNWSRIKQSPNHGRGASLAVRRLVKEARAEAVAVA